MDKICAPEAGPILPSYLKPLRQQQPREAEVLGLDSTVLLEKCRGHIAAGEAKIRFSHDLRR